MLRTCRARLTHTCVRSHYAATILPRVPNALGPNNHRVLWEPRQIISGTKKRRGLVQPVRPGHATQLGAGVQTRPAQLAHSRGRVCCCTGVWHDAPAAVHIAGSKKAWCARLVPRIHHMARDELKPISPTCCSVATVPRGTELARPARGGGDARAGRACIMKNDSALSCGHAQPTIDGLAPPPARSGVAQWSWRAAAGVLRAHAPTAARSPVGAAHGWKRDGCLASARTAIACSTS